MEVPIMPRRVGVEAPQVGAPKLQPITQAASGANIFQAAQKLGQTVEAVGAQLSEHLIKQRRLDAQQKALDKATAYSKEMQEYLSTVDKVGQPKGLLTRTGVNARGALADFDTHDEELRAKYLADSDDFERGALQKLIDNHGTAYRNRVVNHELEQTEISRQQSVEAQVQSLHDAGSAATKPEDLASLLDDAIIIRKMNLISKGADKSDAALMDSISKKTADEFVGAAVKNNLERNPELAQKLLDHSKGLLSEPQKVSLQSAIDGKMLDTRRTTAWDLVRTIRHDDGNSDLADMLRVTDAWIAGQGEKIPQDQRDHIRDYVRQQASVQDSTLRDARESMTRAFYNDALKVKESGVSFEQASEALFKKRGYGFDARDRMDKEQWLLGLYTGKGDPYDKMIEHQDPAQKRAWESILVAIEGKYGKAAPKGQQIGEVPGYETKVDMSSAFTADVKAAVLGKPAPEMKRIFAEMLKQAPTPPSGGFWDKFRREFGKPPMKEAWLGDRELEQQAQVLGSPTANAIMSLRNHGKAVSKTAIKAVLNEYPDGKY